MLDPNRYSLDAATVGFRKRMRQSVDWSSFNEALQTQTESIKVRRELKETPVSEIHVMGGQGFGVAGNQKTNEMERQARQMNGYVLRSFLATGGAVVLPTKHTEGLMATPQNRGLPQYTQYNGVIGNYVSSFTEPLNAPMDSGTIALAKLGIQAKSEASTNPFKYLQFQLNMHKTQEEIKALEEQHMQLRAYNQEGSIQQAYLADLKARRGDIKESVAETKHRVATTPSSVRQALHRPVLRGKEGEKFVPKSQKKSQQAIEEALSPDVIRPSAETPFSEPKERGFYRGVTEQAPSGIPERGTAAYEEILRRMEEGEDLDLGDLGAMGQGGKEDMSSYASTPASGRSEGSSFNYNEDETPLGILFEEFKGGIRPSLIRKLFDEEKGNYTATKEKLRLIQEADMTSVAENLNLSVTTNAVTEGLGLEKSDDPDYYKNDIAPAFQSHVRDVINHTKNLLENTSVNNNSDMRSFTSGPAKSYSNQLVVLGGSPGFGSPSGVATYRPSDASSLANDMRTGGFNTLSPEETSSVLQRSWKSGLSLSGPLDPQFTGPRKGNKGEILTSEKALRRGSKEEILTSEKGNKVRVNVPVI